VAPIHLQNTRLRIASAGLMVPQKVKCQKPYDYTVQHQAHCHTSSHITCMSTALFQQRLLTLPPRDLSYSNYIYNNINSSNTSKMTMLTSKRGAKADTTATRTPFKGNKLSFPFKLYKLLDDSEKGLHSDIVSWIPDGTGFEIHKTKEFCDTIMNTYFNQSQLKSFTRQRK
jgi:glucosamine 6-phosphate synthetase-like amidotransferase/phosphosugar isomerase protein